MRSIQTPITASPTKPTIPITRMDYQSWSDIKKGIRDKVYSKVQGFENQKFIQKEELLYNFRNEKPTASSNSLRTSTTYAKNHMDNAFPKQESPFKMGLTTSIYSSPKIEAFDIKPKTAQYETSKSSNRDKRQSEVIDYTRKTKPLNERVSLTEIIRISSHLQDIPQNEISGISSGYLQELLGLQNNINRILKNCSTKLYK